jgi:hypothetical protein
MTLIIPSLLSARPLDEVESCHPQLCDSTTTSAKAKAAARNPPCTKKLAKEKPASAIQKKGDGHLGEKPIKISHCSAPKLQLSSPHVPLRL